MCFVFFVGVVVVFDFEFNDEYWMCYVLMLVKCVWEEGEVLVGVVLVYNNQVIGEGWNWLIGCYDFIVYVEIMVLCQGGLVL